MGIFNIKAKEEKSGLKRMTVMSNCTFGIVENRFTDPRFIESYNKNMPQSKERTVERFEATRDMIKNSFEGLIKSEIRKNYAVYPNVNKEMLDLLIQKHARELFNKITNRISMFNIKGEDIYAVFNDYIDETGEIKSLYAYIEKTA